MNADALAWSFDGALRTAADVQSDAAFIQHSEVAGGASELLQPALGDAGRHTCTSVGVRQLPKSARLELDLIVPVKA